MNINYILNIDKQIDFLLSKELSEHNDIDSIDIELLIDKITSDIYNALNENTNVGNNNIDLLYNIKILVFKRIIALQREKYKKQLQHLSIYRDAFNNAGIFSALLSVSKKDGEYVYNEYIKNYKLISAARNMNMNEIFVGNCILDIDLEKKTVSVLDNNFMILKNVLENILFKVNKEFDFYYFRSVINNYIYNLYGSSDISYKYIDNHLLVYKKDEIDVLDKGKIDSVVCNQMSVMWDRVGRKDSSVEKNIIRFIAAPIVDDTGGISNVIVNAIDITDLYKYKKTIQLFNNICIKNFGLILVDENDNIYSINTKGLLIEHKDDIKENNLFRYIENIFGFDLSNRILNIRNVIIHNMLLKKNNVETNVSILFNKNINGSIKKYEIVLSLFFEKDIYQGCGIFISDITDTENLKEKTLELNKVEKKRVQDMHDFIKWITAILELRDDDTGEHVNRVQYYTYVLAVEYFKNFIKKCKDYYRLNMSNISESEDEYIFNCVVNEILRGTNYSLNDLFEDVPKNYNYNMLISNYIELIYHTSLFHDMGKVGISDVILNKSSKLTDDEFELIKNHTTIIDNSKLFMKDIKNPIINMSRLIIRHHHERYDGSGYPDGLLKDKIPLCAHIVSMADVIDALSTKRVYKEAYDFDKVYDIIVDSVNKQFSPDLVEVFKSKKDVIKKYIEKNSKNK